MGAFTSSEGAACFSSIATLDDGVDDSDVVIVW